MPGKFTHKFTTFLLPLFVLLSLSLRTSSPKPQHSPQVTHSLTKYNPGQEKNQGLWNPTDWIALGGCWDFSNKIFFSQGYKGGNKAYYNNKEYKNLVYEVKVMKLAEDGPLGIVFRFDETTDEGYTFLVYPHGEYLFLKFNGLNDFQLKRNSTAHLNEELNTWNKLKVIAYQDKFDFYINDNFLVSVRDNTHQSGKVGLYCSGDTRQIAKFELLSLVEK